MGRSKRLQMFSVLLVLTFLAPSVAGVQEAMGTKVRRVGRSARQLKERGYLETRRQYGEKFRFELEVVKGREQWHRLHVTEKGRGKTEKVGYLEALPGSHEGGPAMVIHGNVEKNVALKVEGKYRGRRFMRVMLSQMLQIAALAKMEWFVVRAPTREAIRLYKRLGFDDDPSGANQLLFPLKEKGGPGYPSISPRGPAPRLSRLSFQLAKSSDDTSSQKQLPLPQTRRSTGTTPPRQRTLPFGVGF